MNPDLKPGTYVIMAPEHIENDVINILIEDLHDLGKVSFEYGEHYLFAFSAARGIGPYAMIKGDVSPGTVDCDYAALIVIPLDLIKELNNPYTLWFLSNGVGYMACPFKIEKEYAPEYENGIFTLADISIDTNVIVDADGNEVIKNLQPGEQLSRKMTLYVMLQTEFNRTKTDIQD